MTLSGADTDSSVAGGLVGDDMPRTRYHLRVLEVALSDS